MERQGADIVITVGQALGKQQREGSQLVIALATQREDMRSNPQNPHTGTIMKLQVPVAPELWGTEAGGLLGLLAASLTPFSARDLF